MTMALNIESSTKPVARSIKMLVYGDPGSGKTWFSIHAPNPLIIDTEASSDPYRGQPGMPEFQVTRTAQPGEIIEALEQFAGTGAIQGLKPDTLVVDSLAYCGRYGRKRARRWPSGAHAKSAPVSMRPESHLAIGQSSSARSSVSTRC